MWAKLASCTVMKYSKLNYTTYYLNSTFLLFIFRPSIHKPPFRHLGWKGPTRQTARRCALAVSSSGQAQVRIYGLPSTWHNGSSIRYCTLRIILKRYIYIIFAIFNRFSWKMITVLFFILENKSIYTFFFLLK